MPLWSSSYIMSNGTRLSIGGNETNSSSLSVRPSSLLSIFLLKGYLIDVIESDTTGAALRSARAAGGDVGQWKAWIGENADSIWQHGACVPPTSVGVGAQIQVPALFGYRFRGPCSWAFGGPTATTQTSALDAFTAAAEWGTPGPLLGSERGREGTERHYDSVFGIL